MQLWEVLFQALKSLKGTAMWRLLLTDPALPCKEFLGLAGETEATLEEPKLVLVCKHSILITLLQSDVAPLRYNAPLGHKSTNATNSP